MWLHRRIPAADRRLRHRRALGPVTVTIAAPPEVVFDVVAAPYLGRTPRALDDKLRVVVRGRDLVVADHYTPIFGGRWTVTTRETVGFERPRRVSFRLLSGPVAHVEERYRLDPVDDGTLLTYDGTLASNLPVLGRWWARTNAATWEHVVRGSLHEIAAEAERLARTAIPGAVRRPDPPVEDARH